MKKNLLLLIGLIICPSAFATQKIIVVNKSTKYDIILTYKVCDEDNQKGIETCPSNESTLIIKAKTTVDPKNYEFIFADDPLPNHYNILRFIDAQEKDPSGNIMAEGKFITGLGVNYLTFASRISLKDDTEALILDDEGTPYIFWTMRSPVQINI